MGLDSRFTTTILIFKLINIDKFSDMEKSDSVTMSGPRTIYQDAQNTILGDLTTTFFNKKKMYSWSTNMVKSFITTMLKGHLIQITIRHNV